MKQGTWNWTNENRRLGNWINEKGHFGTVQFQSEAGGWIFENPPREWIFPVLKVVIHTPLLLPNWIFRFKTRTFAILAQILGARTLAQFVSATSRTSPSHWEIRLCKIVGLNFAHEPGGGGYRY